MNKVLEIFKTWSFIMILSTSFDPIRKIGTWQLLLLSVNQGSYIYYSDTLALDSRNNHRHHLNTTYYWKASYFCFLKVSNFFFLIYSLWSLLFMISQGFKSCWPSRQIIVIVGFILFMSGWILLLKQSTLNDIKHYKYFLLNHRTTFCFRSWWKVLAS